MNEMKSLTLNNKTYDSFVDRVARSLSVGSAIIGSASGENITLPDASNYNPLEFHIYGKTTQDGTPTPDAPVELVSVGDSGSVGVMVIGKNILENAATVKSMNGVEFTVNANGSITANGTANSDILFAINSAVYGIIPGESYTISGCPTVNGACRLYFAQHNDAGAIANTNTYDSGSGATAKILPECKYLWVGFYVDMGTVFSGDIIYPMVRLASVTDATYEPYKCQMITISTPNGLPGIPVTSGGNYTDAEGQQWICDEIDLTNGVYVQRVYRKKFTNADGIKRVESGFGYRFAYATPQLVRSDKTNGVCSLCDSLPLAGYGGTFSTPNCYTVNGIEIMIALTGSETIAELADYLAEKPIEVQAVLVEPIETPLSEEELAAYAALHTYRDHTTVFNDAGAYMELECVMDAKKYIDSLVKASPARISSVTLRASAWVGNASPYSQVVAIDGVTENSQVDLTPSVEQLAVFHHKDLAFVTENEDGVVTVYAIGDKPTNDYSVQVTITEVYV